jgi:isopenicillin-N epimerase
MHLIKTVSSDRRAILKGLVAAAVAPLAAPAMAAEGLPKSPTGSAAAIATDKVFWDAVRALYAVTGDVINLENGYWGLMAEPVRREFIRQADMVNYQNSYYARQHAGADFEAVRAKVAEAVGVAAEEIALTRGATEALQLLIGGYNRLKAGDTVLYADLDYDSMQYAMNALKARRRNRQVRRAGAGDQAGRAGCLCPRARRQPEDQTSAPNPCQPPDGPRHADRRDRADGKGQADRHHRRRGPFVGTARFQGSRARG